MLKARQAQQAQAKSCPARRYGRRASPHGSRCDRTGRAAEKQVVSQEAGARKRMVTTPSALDIDVCVRLDWSTSRMTAVDGVEGCWKLRSYFSTVDDARSPTMALDGCSLPMKPECRARPRPQPKAHVKLDDHHNGYQVPTDRRL
eukprot:4804485-Prymnesium_polylepis.2